MLNGVVVKAHNSFYYVKTETVITVCRLRGRFKKETFSLLVGDIVEYCQTEQGKGVIEKILPRATLLRRPLVANVNQVVVVFAAANPDINSILVDRFIALAELSDLDCLLCINKMDLADTEIVQPLIDLYRKIGYPVFLVAAKEKQGLEDLRKCLIDKVTVFAGPSGVGKSTILNGLQPELYLQTGEVSAKIGRGKHTTRYAQLLPLDAGGLVVDTPGFSSTEFGDVAEQKLASCFREFYDFSPKCKFSTCIHYKEPQCAVKQAVEEDKIAKWRYDSYISMLIELKESR